MARRCGYIALTLLTICIPACAPSNPSPDLILHHAKILTVDQKFSIHQAIAIKAGRILAIGSNAAILNTKSPQTQLIDLQGQTVLPGLIDSHVHPAAAMTEFDHPIPDMQTIAD